MGLRLSETSEKILTRAKEIGEKNNFLGVEHVFLSLIERERDLIDGMLYHSGLSVDDLLQEMDRLCWPTSEKPIWRNFLITPRMKLLGKTADKEALKSRSMRIEPVHYLITILKERRGVIPLSLNNAGAYFFPLLRNMDLN